MSSNVVSFPATGGTGASLTAVTGLQPITTGLAVKIRVKGAIFAAATADSSTYSIGLVSNDGVYANRKMSFFLRRGVGTTNLNIEASATGTTAKSAIFDLATIVQTDYYILYFHFQNTVTKIQAILYDSSGTVIAADNSTQANSTFSTAAGNGTVKLANSGTQNNAAITIDGFALYSGVLTGANQYSAPSASDSGLLAGVTFDEGSGTSAANLKSGEAAFALTTPTWISGGAWDNATASVVSGVGYYLRRRHEA